MGRNDVREGIHIAADEAQMGQQFLAGAEPLAAQAQVLELVVQFLLVLDRRRIAGDEIEAARRAGITRALVPLVRFALSNDVL